MIALSISKDNNYFIVIAINILANVRISMKTIQMTLDEELLNRVDQLIQELNMTRWAFIRESLQSYLEKIRIKKLEKKQREGYL